MESDLEMLPLSGIRRMFSLAATMKDVIHLSIGQPDFPTPAPIVEAHVKALREDKTHYTMDAGLLRRHFLFASPPKD